MASNDIKRRRLDSPCDDVQMTRPVAKYLKTTDIVNEIETKYDVSAQFKDEKGIYLLVLVGNAARVESARTAVNQKISKLPKHSFTLSKEVLQRIENLEVSAALVKLEEAGVLAGWDVNAKEGKIRICSNTEENLKKAYRMLCEPSGRIVPSNVSSQPTLRLKSDQTNDLSYKLTEETLRYLYAKGVHKSLEKIHNVKIIFRVKDGLLNIEGKTINAEKAKAKIKGIVDSLACDVFPLSSGERQRIKHFTSEDIMAEFLKLNLIAGWCVSDNSLCICSENRECVNKAKQVLMALLSVDIEVSSSHLGNHVAQTQDQGFSLAPPGIVHSKLELGLAQLRYLNLIQDETLNKKFKVSINIDFSACCVNITGDQQNVFNAREELQNAVKTYSTRSYPLKKTETEIFFKCLLKLEDNCIEKELQDVTAGWEIRDGELWLCSDSSYNVEYAKSTIYDLVIQSTYPDTHELSEKQRAAIDNSLKWQPLLEKMKSQIACLELQFNENSSKIQFAVLSSADKQTVLQSLKQFFDPFVLKTKKIALQSSKISLCVKNTDYIKQICRLEPQVGELLSIEFHDQSVELSSYSQKSLDYASEQFDNLLKQIKKKEVSAKKTALMGWLSSPAGNTSITAIESNHHTIAKVSRKTVSKPQRIAAPTKVSYIGKMSLIAGDITDAVKNVEGILTNLGNISAAVLKATNNGQLVSGLQRLKMSSGGTICVFHIDVAQWNPISSLPDLKTKLETALSKFEAEGLKSVLLPAIGTGNLGYPAASVADMMLMTLLEYLDDNPQTSLKQVTFITYQQDSIYQAFNAKLTQMKDILVESIQSSTPVETMKKVKVIFRGLTHTAVESSAAALEAEMKNRLIVERWMEPSHRLTISKLSLTQATKLKEEASRRNVDIEISPDHNITIEGLKEDVQALKEKIHGVLCNITESSQLLPSNWDKGVQQQQVKLDQQKNRDEYEKVHGLFLKTCSTSGVRIIEIIRIQNAELHTQYQAQKSRVQKELAGNSLPVERSLWHGTDSVSVRKICQQEFNRSFCGKNGVAYGQGVYFSTTSQYSMDYSKDQREKCMILAKVATGKYFVGNSSTTRKDIPEGFHSTVDNAPSPSIFVVYHDAAAYPEYVIKFMR